jgi:hypothetical protein
MELEAYIELLQETTDTDLSLELGICDNWPILLNADFDTIIEQLKQLGSYRHTDERVFDGGVKHLFDYTPGIIILQVYDWVSTDSTTNSGCDESERGMAETNRQLNDYNMTIMLHPYQKKKIEGIHDSRAIAIVVEDLGLFAINNNLPLCMPKTWGWNHLNEKDYSKLVYRQKK